MGEWHRGSCGVRFEGCRYGPVVLRFCRRRDETGHPHGQAPRRFCAVAQQVHPAWCGFFPVPGGYRQVFVRILPEVRPGVRLLPFSCRPIPDGGAGRTVRKRQPGHAAHHRRPHPGRGGRLQRILHEPAVRAAHTIRSGFRDLVRRRPSQAQGWPAVQLPGLERAHPRPGTGGGGLRQGGPALVRQRGRGNAGGRMERDPLCAEPRHAQYVRRPHGCRSGQPFPPA